MYIDIFCHIVINGLIKPSPFERFTYNTRSKKILPKINAPKNSKAINHVDFEHNSQLFDIKLL